MYKQYFGLTDAPFSITPDPRFVYFSSDHEDALAHLQYGIGQGGGGGFVQLTGEVGTGKTTLCRCLLEQLPEDTRPALILNPRLDPIELLEAICDELGVSTRGARGSQKRLVDKLNTFLLDAHGKGLTVVLIIDEAQNLSPEALEQVRLLTNLETATQKLLQIVFLGQPELRDILRRTDLRQLAQRITARYHLGPLNALETAAYTRHRLTIAGCTQVPFSTAGLRSLHRLSGGVPRLINIIAERSLLAAYAQDRRRIGPATVRQAAAEVLDQGHGTRAKVRPWVVAAGLSVAVAGLAIWAQDQSWGKPSPAVPALESTAVATSDNGAVVTTPEMATVVPAPAEVPAEIAEIEPPAQTDSPVATNMGSGEFSVAWQSLFQLRGLGEAPIIEAGRCDLRVNVSTYCLEGRGTLFRLQQLGRPVLLHLPALKPGFVVLSVQPGQLTLTAGDHFQHIDSAQLEPLWAGRYWDVWQMPAYVPILMQEGERGPGVLWVKAAASRCDPPFAVDLDDPYFGASLKQWAMTFQLHSGLRADGLIGPETLQLLARYGEP
jgi:general secretion pathway protein A